LLYVIGQWKVPKENSKKHYALVMEEVRWWKANPKKSYFVHSTYGVLETEDQSVETWMYIDTYRDRKSYDKFLKVWQKDNPEYAEFFKFKGEWEPLIVPNSYTEMILAVKPELRIS